MHQILEYTSRFDKDSFSNDQKTIDAVIRNFEIIGEAVRNLPQELKVKYPEIPWEEMYRLRNRLSHEYFGIDYDILWDILRLHIPENLKQVEEVISNERAH